MNGWTKNQYAIDFEEMNIFVEDYDRDRFNKIVDEYYAKLKIKKPIYLCEFVQYMKKDLVIEMYNKLMELDYKQ